MGTWGINTFDNDDAADWLYDLEESEDLSLIEDTLEKSKTDYLEAPEGCEILAASEIFLALLGNKRKNLPEIAKEWLSNNKKLDPTKLKKKAIKAIDKVLSEDSELNELWQDSDKYKAWRKNVEQMKTDLLK